jgi:excisionase family DNA binding protein
VTGRSELETLFEGLVERIAERVCERLVDHQGVASESRSPWMGIERAAEYVDWPKQRLYKLTAAGAIPHYKHEGRLLFRSDELDRWLERFAEAHNLRAHTSS